MNFEVIYYVLTVFFPTLAPALKVEAEWGIKLPNESFTTIINLINPIKIIYQKKKYKPITLVILDGWGLSDSLQGNVLKKANLPAIDKLNKFYPLTAIQASGISVGIPWGESGNSEVGHMTMGAGRIIYQSLPRITLAIQDRSFFKNGSLLSAMNSAKK